MKSNEQMIYDLMEHCKDSVGHTRRLKLIKDDLNKLKQLEEIEEKYKIDLITYFKEPKDDLSKELNLCERDEKIIKFIQVLVNLVPKSKLTKNGISSLTTDESYDTVEKYFESKMKELFNLDVTLNIK